MLSKIFGYLFLVAAAILVLSAAYLWFAPPGALLFSPTQLLEGTWRNYRNAYLDSTFRTIDKQRGGVTTSEGQSYTMLRAVWAGDKATFDGAWSWTQKDLQRPDHLFSWLWGARPDGTFGILTAQSGQNTASDADSDIALALIFAYARWQDPAYLDAARSIITSIWDKEVVVIGGKPYLAADDLEKTAATPWIVVDPSYLSPASYHIFAAVDPSHPWEALRTASYALLQASTNTSFDGQTSANLPPDWVRVSRTTGTIIASSTASADANFGFDAFRVPFRVALDAEWFKNPAATDLLKNFSFLSQKWEQGGRLASVYGHNGSVLENVESAAMYGGTLGYFQFIDPQGATAIYRRKLISLYNPTYGSWSTPLSYYDDNWVWFGIALYNHELPNLEAQLPASAFSQ